MLTSSEGEETLTFEFKGAIDGREYPVKRSMGSGKVRINRTDERTLNSVFKSDDGRWTETAKTSISTDGRTMRRTIRQDSPSGKMEWTEVYERR
jgi:hypothetical protein